MSERQRTITRRRVSVAGLVVAAALAVLPAAPVGAAAPGAPRGSDNVPCADIRPLDEVQAGQIGTGWTVVRGAVPKPFRAEVLGVYPDGVAPGRDIIIVEVGDLPGRNVIGVADGIWAGMSGSPVYVDGELIGAVAYGFSAGPNPIGGLTPAEDMERLLSYPGGGSRGARVDRVRLSGDLRRALARRVGAAGVGDFDRLPVPVAVSGLNARGRAAFRERLAEQGIDAIVTRGSAARVPAGVTATPVPGGNFSALISYGDFTAGSVGTTTWACGDQALAFGHPFALSGPATLGANGGLSLAIVDDPTLTPFKLANIGRPFGSVDQDRLAGLRAQLGTLPDTVPVTARVRDLDLGILRDGRSEAAATDWVPLVAPNHLFADLISVTDRDGPGTARLRFTIEGRRANGNPFSLVVSDRIVSDFSIQFESAVRLDEVTAALGFNGFQEITFTRVRANAQVTEELQQTALRRVLISRNGGPFQEREQIRVRVGDSLTVRALLRDGDGTSRQVERTLVVPDDVGEFGALVVAGGGELFSECDFDPEACEVGSFNALLEALGSAPRGDDLVFDLSFSSFDGSSAGGSVRTVVRQPAVVSGNRYVSVSVRP
jgi:hypothetical protein